MRCRLRCQNQLPWMTLKGRYAHVSKHVRLSELTVTSCMKIDLYAQRRICSHSDCSFRSGCEGLVCDIDKWPQREANARTQSGRRNLYWCESVSLRER